MYKKDFTRKRKIQERNSLHSDERPTASIAKACRSLTFESLRCFGEATRMANEVEPAWKPERPLLLTQQQAADLLNISPRMIRYLVRQRKLPVKFIGKDKSKRPKCLIPRSAVEKFARKLAGQ